MKPGIRTLVRPALAVLAVLAASPAAAQSIQVFGCTGHPSCAPPPPNRHFTAVAAGNYHWMGLKSDGSVVAWGLCDMGQCQAPWPNTGYLEIAAGDSHSLGMRAGGVIDVWGSNEYGQYDVPEPNSGFVAMSAGLLHSLALRSDGSIACWGGGISRGECDIPQPNSGWVGIAGGGFLSMGLRADGSIHKWGCAGPCPGPPEPNTGFVAMATSHRHSLGLKADGSIVAWGDNESGQLDVPAPNSGFTAVAAGEDYSLALRSDGSIACFGSAWCAGVPLPNTGNPAVATNTATIPAALRAEAPCQSNDECDDGAFCNGLEACNAGTCETGPPPCAAPLFCRETDDACMQCLVDAHCNDGLFCNGAETCSGAGSCLAGANPCPGIGCDEEADACVGGAQVWLSFNEATFVPGVGTVTAQDIVARNVVTGAWSLVFDGSDVGLGGLVLDGMARMDDGSILLSFTAPATIPGMTGGPSGASLDDSDIVRFVPATLGAETSGSFVFHFDGSDVGLTHENEDIDAIALTGAGELLISTTGNASANGASGGDADLLRFSATSLGASTAGTFTLHFDGSDVELADANEDVDAAGSGPDGTLLLSTVGPFAAGGVTGADEDVLQFTPATLGGTTSGSFALYLDLGALGISTFADVGSVEFVP